MRYIIWTRTFDMTEPTGSHDIPSLLQRSRAGGDYSAYGFLSRSQPRTNALARWWSQGADRPIGDRYPLTMREYARLELVHKALGEELAQRAMRLQFAIPRALSPEDYTDALRQIADELDGIVTHAREMARLQVDRDARAVLDG